MSDVYSTPQSNLTPERSGDRRWGSLEDGVNGNYHFRVGELISEAWERTSGAKLTIILAGIVYFAVMFGVSLVMGFVIGIVGPDSGGAAVVLAILNQVVVTAVSLPLGMGLFMLGLKRSVDAPLNVGEVFNYFHKALPLLLTAILMYVMLFIGFLLLVLPGIYLMFSYYLALPLVIEKNLSPWQALEASRKAVTKRWFAVFGLFLLLGLINFVAMIPLGIGLIWTIPMTMICYGALYRNVFGVEDQTMAG
ncbi:predicted integral membrane protein [Hahella chejuensis KCTC 2396]|uniref:Predicted integral membrane protein n=1 Tax=Hahella chejuensis (strain KCTC 2396) TaxID=349521 RepID=Q2SNM5_HAHCH|nr:integral membrane protein [Hahella chejuensis]ABC27749.1 predicted integral membrane protein [Hahella chejuensis KCTC 2396]